MHTDTDAQQTTRQLSLPTRIILLVLAQALRLLGLARLEEGDELRQADHRDHGDLELLLHLRTRRTLQCVRCWCTYGRGWALPPTAGVGWVGVRWGEELQGAGSTVGTSGATC